jgi:hypothetical protein
LQDPKFDLIKSFISQVQIERFQEIIPSMNDIFIQQVNLATSGSTTIENNIGTKSNFTE